MKKIFSLLLFVSVLCVCTSACDNNSGSMVKSERKFAKYMNSENKDDHSGMIDLSEGPKVQYNANFGPKAPSFDFKIVDPY